MELNYEEILKHTITISNTPWKHLSTAAKFKLLSLSSSFFSLVFPLFSLFPFHYEMYIHSRNFSMVALLLKLTKQTKITGQTLIHMLNACLEPFKISPETIQIIYNNIEVLKYPHVISQALYYSQQYNIIIPDKIEITFMESRERYYSHQVDSIISLSSGPFDNAHETLLSSFILHLGKYSEQPIITKIKQILSNIQFYTFLRELKERIKTTTTQTFAQNSLPYAREIIKREYNDYSKKEWERIMHKAAENGHDDYMCSLAKNGVDLNCKDAKGFSAFLRYVLCSTCSVDGLHNLEQHGADIYAVDRKGRDAYYFAKNFGGYRALHYMGYMKRIDKTEILVALEKLCYH